MNIGEVISALVLCANEICNDNKDYLLLAKDVCNIEVNKDNVNIYFADTNTSDISVDKNGNKEYL